MFRTTVRNLFAHKARLLMTMLAIVLGVAFVSGTLIFTDTIQNGLDGAVSQSHAQVSVSLRTTKAATENNQVPQLDDELAARLRMLPGVRDVAGAVSGYAGVVDRHGDLIRPHHPGVGANQFAGDGAGCATGTDSHCAYVSGGPPGVGQVALDRATADDGGYRVGDSVRLVVGGEVVTERLSGVFTSHDEHKLVGGSSFALFDTASAQHWFTRPGRFDHLVVRAAPGVGDEQLRAAIAALAPPGTEAVTRAKLVDEDRAANAKLVDGFRTGLLAFAGIALFVGAFVIANTFTMLVAQRTRELALLRAIGASRRQVTRSVLIESALVGLLSALVGFAVGPAIAALLRSLFLADAPHSALVVGPKAVLASLGVGVVVTVLAAWLPARRAAKVPPVAALGLAALPTPAGRTVRRAALGAAVVVVGIALSAFGAARGSGGRAAVGFGALLLLTGLIVVTPALAKPVLGPTVRPLRRLFGITGRLAVGNAVRDPRRTAATASALMIGLTLVTTLSVFGASVQRALTEHTLGGLRADHAVSMVEHSQKLGPKVAETVAKVPGVAASSPIRATRLAVGDGSAMEASAVDPATVDRLIDLGYIAGSAAGLGDGILLSEDRAGGLRAGDRVVVRMPDGARVTLPVGGIFTNTRQVSGYLIALATLAPHVGVARDDTVLIAAAPGQEAAIGARIKAALGDDPSIAVQTRRDIEQMYGATIDLALNLVYGLLAMAVVIAVLGIVNTLAMSVFERTREIGMLRSIGLRRGQVGRMVALESLLISLLGAALGIVLGTGIAWAAGRTISPDLHEYTTIVPWARLGLFLVIAGCAGIVAGFWPARRAARMNILAAIHAE
ncbi:ABC transporter permease [Embleya sp. AB8]|uniref:ABC transporter permease n=1 Tax=Embleya sp. AB8 TaxID=3156304 RepID=UPI003C73FCEE